VYDHIMPGMPYWSSAALYMLAALLLAHPTALRYASQRA
jgi:hypothetical protein